MTCTVRLASLAVLAWLLAGSHSAAQPPTGICEPVGVELANPSGDFTVAHVLKVLENAKTLALRRSTVPGGWAREAREILELQEQAEKLPATQPAPDLYLRSRLLARRIAFSNPLLQQIRQLLFITRHDSGGVFHMVDQFYGFNAKPGGDLLVLVEPFGSNPRVVRLLQNSVVERGRLQGRKLESGSFLSPEVSFDGQRILFAWTEAKGKDLV